MAEGAHEAGDEPSRLHFAAKGRATRSVPTAGPSESADSVRRRLAGSRFDSAAEVVVLEGDRLAGFVALERLLAAPGAAPITEIMDREPPVLEPVGDEEITVREAAARGAGGFAVVDGQGRFAGLIPATRMLEIALIAHEEDLARLGGYLSGSAQARGAARESVTRRLWHRLPWLLLGLAGAMASALIVGAFESRLDENVALAFFIPAIVYMADAVGTQTETVLIRALAAGVTVREVVRRELLTGLVLGTLIGAAFLPFSLAVWGDAEVAVAVALALFASSSIATLVAMVLPAAFQRLGRDPAFGSGPLATVLQDLLSIVVYFALVVIIV